jgi:hypothetical protein
MFSRVIFVLWLALISLTVSAQETCGRFPESGFDSPENRSFRGRYENPNYYFGVTIPPDLTGHDGPAPNPHHGFGIVLSWEPRSYAWVDGTYNALFYPGPRAALRAHLGYLREDGASVVAVRTSRIKLGGLPSSLQVVRYKCPKTPGYRIVRQTIVIRNGVVYTVGLDSPEARDKEDSLVFDALLATWHLTCRKADTGRTTKGRSCKAST